MRGLAIGSFDIFHLGHVRFLAACKGEVDHLTVAVNTDEFAAEYKRPPVCTLDERIQVVEACKYVDRAVVNTGGRDSRPVILDTNPDLLFHGDDWPVDSLLVQLGVTEAWLDSQGVILTLVPYTNGVSTSQIIERIIGLPEAKRGWFR